MNYFLYYLLLINAAGLALMLSDKMRAQKNKWRIRESVLLGTAAIGGSIGTWLGMKMFRHKTRHVKFSIGLPVIITLQLLLAGWIIMNMK